MAESPDIGLRMGFVGSDMSMMTTWAASVLFSLMQMNLSLSIVRVLKEMLDGWMPTLVSCKCSWKRIGNACVILAAYTIPN